MLWAGDWRVLRVWSVVAGLALTVKMSEGGPGQLTDCRDRGGASTIRLSPSLMVKMSAAHSL